MSRLLLAHPDLRSQALVLALSTVLFLPFLNQAVHMDDSIYLDIARNVLRNPLHPHDFPYCFEGYCAPDMASHSHPPFVAYWLAAWLMLSGGSLPEWALHTTYLPFVWLFAVSVFFLARRFSGHPLLCSLIAVSSPVVVVMSHNLMADYPNLACWTAALPLFIAGVDHRRSNWIWISSLFMAISSFTSYPSLVIPLLCWTYVAQRRPGMRAAILAPFVPLLWMGLWLGYSSVYFGRFVLGGTGRYFIESRGTWTLSMLVEKFLAFPVFLMGTVVMPWNLIGQACRWLSGRIAILATLMSAAITQLAVPEYGLAEKALFGCLFLMGVLAVMALAVGLHLPAQFRQESDNERRDRIFLLIWLGTSTSLVLFVYAAASARYMMPLVVPFILLSAGSSFRLSPPNISSALKATLALSLLVSLGLSVADYQAAACNK
jgi:4-amino-4-deoxy-L-arabinose transferase-like glycosyltransferase